MIVSGVDKLALDGQVVGLVGLLLLVLSTVLEGTAIIHK